MFAWGQTSSSLPGSSPGITPPPPFLTQAGPLTVAADSIMMPFRVQQTVPQTYEELMRDQFAAVLEELRRIEAGANVSDELLDTINMIAVIMDGMKED